MTDKQSRILLYGGSFNPPGLHHKRIAEKLVTLYDKVIICPCGNRSDKSTLSLAPLINRCEMVSMTFAGLKKLTIDSFDLERDTFTPTYQLQIRWKTRYPEAEIWHMVGSDLIVGGGLGISQIQQTWRRGLELWQNLNFLVLERINYPFSLADLPPKSKMLDLKITKCSSTKIRQRLNQGKKISNLVSPDVADYIKEHELYIK